MLTIVVFVTVALVLTALMAAVVVALYHGPH